MITVEWYGVIFIALFTAAGIVAASPYGATKASKDFSYTCFGCAGFLAFMLCTHIAFHLPSVFDGGK